MVLPIKRGSGVSKGRFYKVSILIIACVAASVVTNCFSPVGSIGGSASDDLFWAQPNRVAYDMNDLFMRNSDLEVFTSNRGIVQSIPLSLVKIGIAENPDLPDSKEYIPLDENYALRTKGRKLVVVEYKNMSVAYSIEVRDPFGLGGGTGPGPGEGPGIEIEWETPVIIPKP